MIFYLPTFSVFVTLGNLNYSQGLPKIFSTSKVESLKGIRGKNNKKKKSLETVQKRPKIKYGQTNPANCTNCRRADLGQEPTSPSAMDVPGSLYLNSIMLVGGTANPSWSWQI